MSRDHAILHLWPARGGFGLRMDMLEAVLRQIGSVRRLQRPAEILRWLRSREVRSGQSVAIIYTSLLAPLALLLRVFRRRCQVYYMVRGDEVTYASLAGRRFRALAALCFQKLLAASGCRFVFASRDLRSAFVRRYGRLRHCRVLPNTSGRPVPPSRPFDGRVALVGDFGTVKNIEQALECLEGGGFQVDLYGNRSLPTRWRQCWLRAHGPVDNLRDRLRQSTLVVLTSRSEGFPNVVVEAVQAGCGVVVHSAFPFRHLPIAEGWRFDGRQGNAQTRKTGRDAGDTKDAKKLLQKKASSPASSESLPALGARPDLRLLLTRLLAERRDFKQDNPRLVRLIESDWCARVRKVFAESGAPPAPIVRHRDTETKNVISPLCVSVSQAAAEPRRIAS